MKFKKLRKENRDEADLALVWLDPPKRKENREMMAMMFESDVAYPFGHGLEYN
ncbi:hypothetical protein D3C81_2307420 [compost metagenome]